VGVFFVLSGVLLSATTWTRAPDPLVRSWWGSAVYVPDVLGVAAGFAGVAVVLFLGVLWNRYRLATGADSVAKAAGADASFEDETVPDDKTLPDDKVDAASIDESRLPGLAWAGATCMVGGAALLVGYWFVAQQDLGVARTPITVGETLDHYTIPYGDSLGSGSGAKGLKVMLPLRVRLSGLDAGDAPSARLQIFEAGQTPPEPKAMSAGSGLDIKGVRLTFTGMKPDTTKLKAVFASDAPETIAAGAAKGESFQLSLDGPDYKVLEVSRNYLGAMGPAAKVRAPDIGEFWVFQRASQTQVRPDLGHSIELKQLETQPAAIFAIAQTHPFWPISLGGTLFVLGFALLIVFPERIVRHTDGAVGVWSFHEAGRAAEQTLGQLESEEPASDDAVSDEPVSEEPVFEDIDASEAESTHS
jgi:hypothetical protein